MTRLPNTTALLFIHMTHEFAPEAWPNKPGNLTSNGMRQRAGEVCCGQATGNVRPQNQQIGRHTNMNAIKP
jgi:hypothetical protein